MKNPDRPVRALCEGAMVAAVYCLLTLCAEAFWLAIGPIQLRLSEALTVLPAISAASIPGLFVGCLLSNILCGAELLDIVFGSLATLVAVALTRVIAKRVTVLAALPPILVNEIVVPLLLTFVYGAEGTYPFFLLTVFLGEFVSAGILGTALLCLLRRAMPKRFQAKND